MSARTWDRFAKALASFDLNVMPDSDRQREPVRAYLGPELRGPFDQTLPDLLRWRQRCLVFDVAGIFAPEWHLLDPRRQDQLRVLSSHWPGGGGLGAPPRLQPVPEELHLPIFSLHRSRLLRVPKSLKSGAAESTILTDLVSHMPADDDLAEDLRRAVLGPSTGQRGFAAAVRAARSLNSRGCPSRWIGRYLATYGYINAKGVVGAWHYARLTEAMQDDRRE